MFGIGLGDLILFVWLYCCLVFLYLGGKPGSIVYRKLVKENKKASPKMLKLLRVISVVGIVIMTVCIIVSIFL